MTKDRQLIEHDLLQLNFRNQDLDQTTVQIDHDPIDRLRVTRHFISDADFVLNPTRA